MAVSNSDPMLFSCENKCFDAVAVIVVHWDNLLARVLAVNWSRRVGWRKV